MVEYKKSIICLTINRSYVEPKVVKEYNIYDKLYGYIFKNVGEI